MKHEPIVLERDDWRITKAACSCGAELQLAGRVGSVTEQSKKLVAVVSEAQDRERNGTTETPSIRFAKAHRDETREDMNHHPV